MIQLFHVTKSYEGGERPALSEVSFRVPKGDFNYLTGRSGAGKTTLLKLLFAAETATRGQLLINGKNTTNISRRDTAHLRRQIGVSLEQSGRYCVN